MIEFKSIEEPELIEIHKRQNGECDYELADLLDADPPWAPMTLEQVKEAISKNQKKDRTSVFSIWADNSFVGIGAWSSNWDTWGPWNYIFIWPEHRRKGYGAHAARILIDRSFSDSPAHALDTGAPEWNLPAIGFIKSLGFKDAGRMRSSGMKDGKYYDDIIFDMLKSEYQGRSSVSDKPLENSSASKKSLEVSQ